MYSGDFPAIDRRSRIVRPLLIQCSHCNWSTGRSSVGEEDMRWRDEAERDGCFQPVDDFQSRGFGETCNGFFAG